jgi:hypothetical protein
MIDAELVTRKMVLITADLRALDPLGTSSSFPLHWISVRS